MPLVLADRVQETTNTTGTGTLTLAGAVAGFQSFSVIGNANTTYYTIVSDNDWEVGVGTYTSAGTLLSRDTVYSSSAAGAKITVAAGAKVFVTYPSGKAVYEDSSDNVGIGTTTTGSRLRTSQSSTTAYSFIAQTPTVGLTTGDYVNMAYFTNSRAANNDGLRVVNLRDSTGSGVGNWETESYRIRRSVDANDGSSGVQEEIIFGNNTLGFSAGGQERMRIDTNGNVRVGTIGTATDKFEVVGDGLRSVARGSTTAGQSWMEAQVSNYWSGSVFTGTSVNQYGSTAVGTTVGLSNANLGSLLFQNGSAGLIYTNGASPVVFGTNSAERMRIDTSGNVGIGTSTVRAQEHVFGIGQTTAALTDAGARGGMLRVSDNSSAVGAGGAILFANSQGDIANSTGFAAVKGLLADGTTNTIGHLAFSTRATVAATALTERMRITVNGGVSFGATGTAFGTSGQVLQSNGDAPPTWLSGVVTETGTQTLTNKTLTDPVMIGTLIEDVFTITDAAAFEINPGNGSVQLITLTASRTPKATSFVAGEAVTLMVNDGTAFTLTWTDTTFGPSGVIWVGGSTPTLALTGFTVIELWKVSTQVYGALVGFVA